MKYYFNIRCERRDLTELELFDLELEVMLKVSFQMSGSLSWFDGVGFEKEVWKIWLACFYQWD